MKRNNGSIDGFVRRRDGLNLGGRVGQSTGNLAPERGELHTGQDGAAAELADKPVQSNLGTSSLQVSLNQIDDEPKSRKESRRQKRRRLKRERRQGMSRRRRIVKRVVIGLVILAGLGLLFFVGRLFLASSNIFQGDIFGYTQSQPLKQDANGRSNFIVFGTAEDDEGGTHDGPNLTDSLMVLSVHQEKKDAYMFSIPRDLWVNYGVACPDGYQARINSAYHCGSNGGKDEKAGAKYLQKKISEVTGLEIQYYVHLNFTAVSDLVDAVGGVDVTIESNPKGVGILDRNFDWKCQYKCYYVKYNDGEKAHLDGEHALALARARNAQGGYGLANSNFDREKNQQKIVKALREKALSAGTLANPNKVLKIASAIGDNIRTNISTGEVRTLITIGQEIDEAKIRSIDLASKDNPLVTTAMVGTSSVVVPIEGMFQYGQIQKYIRRSMSSNAVVRENARVAVFNASGVEGAARAEADKLEEKGLANVVIGDSPGKIEAGVRIYQIGDGFSSTKQMLAKRYNVDVSKELPFAVDPSLDFVVVMGKTETS